MFSIPCAISGAVMIFRFPDLSGLLTYGYVIAIGLVILTGILFWVEKDY